MSSILTFRTVNSDYRSPPVLVDLGKNINSLDHASSQLPEGAYTTFRTYPNCTALYLDDHFQRLEESLSLAGYAVSLNADPLRRDIRSLLTAYPFDLARVRLTIPFGPDPAVIYISMGALTVPSSINREQGVNVQTIPFIRSNPRAKLTGFINSTSEIRRSLPEGIEEALMVDEAGNILEGLTSNFFAVIQQTIFTAGEGVLNGITRKLVLDIAEVARIKIDLTSPNLKNISNFEEAFITSTSRAVLPVTKINSEGVGNGTPGPVTRQMMEMYEERVAAEIRPI